MNIKQLRTVTIIFTLLALVTGCTAGVSDADGDGIYLSLDVGENAYPSTAYHNDDRPELRNFNIIDTYNTNSEFDGNHLALSAYVNLGYFEIFWDIRSNDDYIIEVLVNDAPYIEGAELVTSEYCSKYDYCYEEQYQICDFSNDYTLSCETPNGYVESTNIANLVSRYEQDIYIIMQTCDTFYEYCEYQTLPVLIE